MKRREFLRHTAGAGLGLIPAAAGLALTTAARAADAPSARPITRGEPLKPPANGRIRAAFAIAEGATVIDFAGPWEVFQDVHVSGPGSRHMMPFELYTVAATAKPITATGGMKIIPNYAIDDAPRPHVVIVPALRGNPALLEWLAAVAPETDVTMSVCTGAFQLARAGLLDGLAATTHHDFYDSFAQEFPRVKLERGLRFVENPRIATSAGLSSGIDLALRVVERYFGRDVARQTADYMEYTGTGWQV
ncbi:MAG TPA: DJ-1/PfpI family protein [Gammaproteobacteria bacterium]|nr:DJ-1/PfpI family protein [Gammaproteobacteria bacterium]